MQKLTRREMVKLAVTAGIAALLAVLTGSVDPEEKVEQLEQPTEEAEIEARQSSQPDHRWSTFIETSVVDHLCLTEETEVGRQ